jgi:hypothetical protein
VIRHLSVSSVQVPDLLPRLAPLHSLLSTRLQLSTPLLSLSGRLELALAQIESRQQEQARSVKADSKVGGTYVEGESDEDSDEGDIEDVGLGGDSSDEEDGDVDMEGELSDEDDEEDDEDKCVLPCPTLRYTVLEADLVFRSVFIAPLSPDRTMEPSLARSSTTRRRMREAKERTSPTETRSSGHILSIYIDLHLSFSRIYALVYLLSLSNRSKENEGDL